MFYAAKNPRVIGSNWHLVAFNSRKERNEFLSWNLDYQPVPAREAATLPQFKYATRYPHTICDELGEYMGFVFFKTNGEFHSVQ